MSTAEKVQCPNCRGDRQVLVFADGHNADGTPWASNGYRDCDRCKGAGAITKDYARRIQIGMHARMDRLAVGLSLHEAARAWGKSASEISRFERGDAAVELYEPRGLSASEGPTSPEAVDPTPETLQHGRRG